jgi:hypothetical protein
MAELPVRLRTSLRRHYPHQVQGVSSTFSRTLLDSQPLRLPRTFFLAQNKTDTSEVNAADAGHFSMTGSAIGYPRISRPVLLSR